MSVKTTNMAHRYKGSRSRPHVRADYEAVLPELNVSYFVDLFLRNVGTRVGLNTVGIVEIWKRKSKRWTMSKRLLLR